MMSKKYLHHCTGSAVCYFRTPEYANSGSPALVLDRVHVQGFDVAGCAFDWVDWRLVVGQGKEKKEWVELLWMGTATLVQAWDQNSAETTKASGSPK